MFPRPRPLAEGVFKFRTTASGSPPTDQDLYRTISDGLPGSRMPEFQRLPEESRRQLVQYVKSLAPIFQEEKPEIIDLGADPGQAKADVKRGEELYTQLGCNACHGDLGRGDGPSAPTLVDQWGKPTRAADLTQGWKFRSGSTPRDILTRLMTGIDGTPMPSYAEAVTATEVWDLAYYVHSLQEKPHWARKLQVAKGKDALPATPEDSLWKTVPRTDVRLSSLLYKGGEVVPAGVHAISVQAVYNGSEAYFRLSWHDPTESRETPSDALTVLLLADRRKKWEVGSLRNWTPVGADKVGVEEITWKAGDAGAASYAKGEWAVVIRRPQQAGAESGLIGFLVWEGGNQEQGRHRASSLWLDLAPWIQKSKHEGD